jgi:hypothetical protein
VSGILALVTRPAMSKNTVIVLQRTFQIFHRRLTPRLSGRSSRTQASRVTIRLKPRVRLLRRIFGQFVVIHHYRIE